MNLGLLGWSCPQRDATAAAHRPRSGRHLSRLAFTDPLRCDGTQRACRLGRQARAASNLPGSDFNRDRAFESLKTFDIDHPLLSDAWAGNLPCFDELQHPPLRYAEQPRRFGSADNLYRRRYRVEPISDQRLRSALPSSEAIRHTRAATVVTSATRRCCSTSSRSPLSCARCTPSASNPRDRGALAPVKHNGGPIDAHACSESRRRCALPIASSLGEGLFECRLL